MVVSGWKFTAPIEFVLLVPGHLRPQLVVFASYQYETDIYLVWCISLHFESQMWTMLFIYIPLQRDKASSIGFSLFRFWAVRPTFLYLGLVVSLCTLKFYYYYWWKTETESYQPLSSLSLSLLSSQFLISSHLLSSFIIFVFII